jgi:hypothetical protein
MNQSIFQCCIFWYLQTPLNNINLKLYVSTIDNFDEIGNDSGHVLDLENTTLKY